MDAPETFHGQVLGCRVVADDAQDPAVDSPLMLAKEQFEGADIALPELIQYIARWVRHSSSLSKPIYGSFGRKVTRRNGRAAQHGAVEPGNTMKTQQRFGLEMFA
jgi:hypothetical protein